MEILILICLIVVIILLVHEKVDISIKRKDSNQIEKKETSVPSLMGPARTFQGKSMPVNDTKSHYNIGQEPMDNFDSENIQQSQSDLEGLEDEWENVDPPNPEDTVNEGVSSHEVKKVVSILQQDNLNAEEKKEAAAIVQKLQGTELFNLIENQIAGSSKKIAALLDQAATTPLTSGRQGEDDFDIREFV